ncbi:MAG TPA: peroxiredoxin-like family protein [bacterium]|nr:peroxiredoxin-like family protein [bacterium]
MLKCRVLILTGLFMVGVGMVETTMADSMGKPVYDSPREVQPLVKGESIPNGELTTLKGKKVELKTLVSQKPSILIFYRGGWCPYCNLQMGQLVKIEPDLMKMGYQLLAITPDKPGSLRESLKKHGINYTLLSDRTMGLTRQFGLAYRLDPQTLEKMKGFGVDLEKSTGNALHELPVPAAFVVDTKGTIHFVYYNADIKVRVNPDDLMKAAKEALK